MKKKSTFQVKGHPPQIKVGGLMVSVGIPEYHLIPHVALRELAERFSLGEERKGKGAWNANATNQEVLISKEALLRRLSHVIEHAMKLMEEVRSDKFGKDNNASAIAWGGAYACCAVDAMKKQKK